MIYLTKETAQLQAQAWCDAWNRRDLDAVMAHYADDVMLNSPTVIKRWGIEDGWLRGKQLLRENFAIGMRTAGMHFELVAVLVGVNSMCIVYRRETGAVVSDLVEVDENGLGTRVVACYSQFEPVAPSRQPHSGSGHSPESNAVPGSALAYQEPRTTVVEPARCASAR